MHPSSASRYSPRPILNNNSGQCLDATRLGSTEYSDIGNIYNFIILFYVKLSEKVKSYE